LITRFADPAVGGQVGATAATARVVGVVFDFAIVVEVVLVFFAGFFGVEWPDNNATSPTTTAATTSALKPRR
jgi:hypothetical protein